MCLCMYLSEYACGYGLGNWLIGYRSQELGPGKLVKQPQRAVCVSSRVQNSDA